MKKILALLASLGMACAAFAQSYPGHPVRFVVPFPPGSLPDQIARVIRPQLQDSLGQPFVIENRPGAIGVIGTAEAARAAPHGHTILITTNSTPAAAERLFTKLQYDPVRAFAPIMRISKTSMILLVRPEFPAHSLKDFISLARSKNGALTAGYGSAGSPASIAQLKAGGGLAAGRVAPEGGAAALAQRPPRPDFVSL